MTMLVEGFAGTAAVSLAALSGRPAHPPVGYMGSKRRWARQLAELLGFADRRPDRVVLVDAGPWGDAWSVLRVDRDRRAVAELLRAWDAAWPGRPSELWRHLVSTAPSTDPVQRVAQYLWLQARSAGTIPIWWEPTRARWESPTGSRTETGHQRGGAAAGSRETGSAYEAGLGSRRVSKAQGKDATDATSRQKSTPNGSRGIQRPATVADRLDALGVIDWGRVDVVHGDVRQVQPIAGATLYLDPPYVGCPRYAALCPRADVVDVATRWAADGAQVLVSEGAPLDLEGWSRARSGSPRRGRSRCRSSSIFGGVLSDLDRGRHHPPRC